MFDRIPPRAARTGASVRPAGRHHGARCAPGTVFTGSPMSTSPPPYGQLMPGRGRPCCGRSSGQRRQHVRHQGGQERSYHHGIHRGRGPAYGNPMRGDRPGGDSLPDGRAEAKRACHRRAHLPAVWSAWCLRRFQRYEQYVVVEARIHKGFIAAPLPPSANAPINAPAAAPPNFRSIALGVAFTLDGVGMGSDRNHPPIDLHRRKTQRQFSRRMQPPAGFGVTLPRTGAPVRARVLLFTTRGCASVASIFASFGGVRSDF